MHRFSKHFELFDYIDPQCSACICKYFSSIYFFCQVKRSKFLKSSPPYADTVIGPNSQQWVGSQDEWLSHTLKEPIFDKSETACISIGSVHLQLFKA
ncbi:hypothetical protein D917_01578 [Trichinella nativa]|uniref:Uncharacterized protein n=1 Tax=Trichinella nativa TaxID=6335 RepID=A0A1Y3EU67_9BILA|nr:hypothetical protein D917_01578 [Trichinella nativa]